MITESTRVTHLKGDLSQEWLDAFRGVERIAWDIETSGLDWRNGKIGTCQLHAPETGTVLVQINGVQPDRLATLLADATVRKVFHHAPFDLRWMTWQWKCAARSVSCTKVASRLLNKDADSGKHSLKHLLEIHLNVAMDKQQRMSDWLADELSPEQVSYAAEDVTHLLPLLDVLEKDLENAGLTSLYGECTRFLPARVQLETGDWPDVFSY